MADFRLKDIEPAERINDGLFLPDLCGIRMLLSVVVLSELLAFILMLASSAPGHRWQDLGLISFLFNGLRYQACWSCALRDHF